MFATDVFFDYGGTLVEGLPSPQPAFADVLQRHGLTVDLTAFMQANEVEWNALWTEAPRMVGQLPSFADRVHERALRRVGVSENVATIVRSIREEAISSRWHPPFPEVDGVIQQLRRDGYRLHIVSNAVDYLPLELSVLGWSEDFESVTFSQEIGAAKPDLRIFELALRRAHCDPSSAVFVGDSWVADYVGSRLAGLRPVFVNRNGEPTPEPCTQIRDLTGLPPLLSRVP